MMRGHAQDEWLLMIPSLILSAKQSKDQQTKKGIEMTFYLYILQCSDDSYYTGHTDDLELRLAQHHQRAYSSCYTATRLPVKLVFQQAFATRTEAFNSEQQIKGWSRKKKEAMMQGNWDEVSKLAVRTSVKNPSTASRSG